MFAGLSDPVPEKVEEKRYGHESTAQKTQQGTRPPVAHPFVHWRSDEGKGGAADAAEKSVAG